MLLQKVLLSVARFHFRLIMLNVILFSDCLKFSFICIKCFHKLCLVVFINISQVWLLDQSCALSLVFRQVEIVSSSKDIVFGSLLFHPCGGGARCGIHCS